MNPVVAETKARLADLVEHAVIIDALVAHPDLPPLDQAAALVEINALAEALEGLQERLELALEGYVLPVGPGGPAPAADEFDTPVEGGADA